VNILIYVRQAEMSSACHSIGEIR